MPISLCLVGLKLMVLLLQLLKPQSFWNLLIRYYQCILIESLMVECLQACLWYLHILGYAFKQLMGHISGHNICIQHNDHSFLLGVGEDQLSSLLFLDTLWAFSFISLHSANLHFEPSILLLEVLNLFYQGRLSRNLVLLLA